MAELRQNTWTLGEWYDQAVADNTGGYTTSAGTAFVWGNNQYGGLGLNQPNPYYKSSPTQLPGTSWKMIDSGYRWSIAVKSDGTLWSWGWNDSGNLGQNNTTNYSSPKQIGSGTDWDKVAAGYFCAMATKTDGTMYGWGNSQGSGVGPGQRSSPIQIPGSDWELPIGNSTASFGVKTNGTLWAWGPNDGGALGLNDRTTRHTPTQVGTDTNWSKDLWKWANRAQADDQAMCIKTDGTLWAWGYNSAGQLGLNEGSNPGFAKAKSSPCQIGSGTDWKSCGGQGATNCASKTDGTMYVWGANSWMGALGLELPSNSHRSSPTQMPGTTWNLVSSANGQFVTRTDGTLWCWGRNNDGSLGLNQPNSQNPNQETNSPNQVGSLTDWTDKISGAIAITTRKEL